MAAGRFHESHMCAQGRGRVGGEADRKKYVSKSFIRRENETFGCSENKGVLS